MSVSGGELHSRKGSGLVTKSTDGVVIMVLLLDFKGVRIEYPGHGTGYGVLWDVHSLNRLERPKKTVPNAACDAMVFRWILEMVCEVVFTQHPSDEGSWRVGVKRKVDPLIGHVGERKADRVE